MRPILTPVLFAAAMLAAPLALATPEKPVATAAAKPVLAYPQALILIRANLAALQQADETGNYQVLYALGAKGFQSANPPQKLAQMFGRLRAFNLNAALVLDPKFTELPHIDSHGLLVMKGLFETEGRHILFQLYFQPENGRWRLFGIGADVR